MTGLLLVVGSYNVGLTVVGRSLPLPGQTVLGHTFDMGPGGKGSNQAIGARRLGAQVDLVVKLGNDRFADDARELFAREGLSGSGILAADTHTGVGLILVDDQGNNMIAIHPGANALLHAEDLDRLPGIFDRASHLLCQLESPVELFAEAAGRARRRGLTTILNPAPARPLPVETLSLADLMTPNEGELGTLTGLPVGSEREVREAASVLLDKGVGQAVVTLGERGALWVHAGGTQHFPAHRVPVRDTTGAGDAFNAGLATALTEGRDMPAAIELGIRAAAFCVGRLGVIDGLPTRRQLDAEVPA
ncbi:MAG: ribokinase [Actinomycetota bacterium]|nr:ribokinase [Actinomycetota bacterium]